jgi:hypothetical protein
LPAASRFVAGNVVEVDQQPRPDGEEPARDFRFLLDDRSDLERRIADGERIADLDIETRREPRIRPGDTSCGYVARRRSALVRGIDEHDPSAQRVLRRHRLDVGEHGAGPGGVVPVASHHAVEPQHGRRREAALVRFRLESIGQRPIARDQDVSAEQQVRLRAERAFHAIGEESDGADAGHRKHHRRDQDRELAGAPVTRQHAESQPYRIHRRVLSVDDGGIADQPSGGQRQLARASPGKTCVVRDEEQRRSVLAIQPEHEIDHFLARRVVEVARGLVSHQELGLAGERASDGNTLLLAPESCFG